MPVSLDQGESLCSIRLEGEIDIASARDLKNLLLEAFASGKELRVNLQAATELDVTALQLLWAAENEARRSGVIYEMAGPVPEEILAVARSAGLERFPVPLESKLEQRGDFFGQRQ